MKKTILIDDEESGIRVLSLLIDLYFPELQVVACCRSIAQAELAIPQHMPDLVFMDVEIFELTAFDLFDRLPFISFKTVFVTAHECYALKAIKFHPHAYLLKPVSRHDLEECLQSLEEPPAAGIPKHTAEIRIPVHHQDKVRFVTPREIISLEADRSYTTIFTQQGLKYTTSKPLNAFEPLLSGCSGFMRINKSVIANLNFIQEYSKGEPCILYLPQGREYEISRRKKAAFNAWIRGWL